jgi:hypothetical protein
VFSVCVLGCATPQSKVAPAAQEVQDEREFDTAKPGGEDVEDESPTPMDTGHSGVSDDATIVAVDMPSAMACGEAVAVSVEVLNEGTATWTRTGGYKLGIVNDSDPFYTHDTRVALPDEVAVEPGDSWTYEFELSAPEVSGSYLTDWQMVHEEVQWFGARAWRQIEVVCAEPDVSPDPPVFSEVIWLYHDVSDWPVTGALSSVSVSSDQICMDYDQADEWPIYDFDGTDVVANPWIFIWHEEQWYAATWEWMRPGHTC